MPASGGNSLKRSWDSGRFFFSEIEGVCGGETGATDFSKNSIPAWGKVTLLCQRIFSLVEVLQLPTNITKSYYKILHLSLQIWYTVWVFRFHHYHTPISSQTLYLQGIPPWLSTYFLLIFIYQKETLSNVNTQRIFFVTAITRLTHTLTQYCTACESQKYT